MINKYEHLINKFRHRFLDDSLKNIGINGPAGPYLIKISEAKTIKMNQIIVHSPFHKSHTTRAINELKDCELIIKVKDPEDQRSFILSITKKGELIADKVIEILRKWDELILSALNEEEKQMMQVITEKIYMKVKEHFEEDLLDEKNV
ncbi:MAG: hypothetical protein KJ971_03350 [Firmicutes bacterium]|nr:hypothetical protein [Bacillota bacterium]